MFFPLFRFACFVRGISPAVICSRSNAGKNLRLPLSAEPNALGADGPLVVVARACTETARFLSLPRQPQSRKTRMSSKRFYHRRHRSLRPLLGLPIATVHAAMPKQSPAVPLTQAIKLTPAPINSAIHERYDNLQLATARREKTKVRFCWANRMPAIAAKLFGFVCHFVTAVKPAVTSIDTASPLALSGTSFGSPRFTSISGAILENTSAGNAFSSLAGLVTDIAWSIKSS